MKPKFALAALLAASVLVCLESKPAAANAKLAGIYAGVVTRQAAAFEKWSESVCKSAVRVIEIFKERNPALAQRYTNIYTSSIENWCKHTKSLVNRTAGIYVNLLNRIGCDSQPVLDAQVVALARIDAACAAAKEKICAVLNDPPTANDDGGMGFETYTIAPLTTASVLTNDTDPNGNPLSVISFDTTGTQGLVTYNGDGTFDYDPNGAFSSLLPGESDTDTFSYTISDGCGGEATATVTITINGLEDITAVISLAFITYDEDNSGGLSPGDYVTYVFEGFRNGLGWQNFSTEFTVQWTDGSFHNNSGPIWSSVYGYVADPVPTGKLEIHYNGLTYKFDAGIEEGDLSGTGEGIVLQPYEVTPTP